MGHPAFFGRHLVRLKPCPFKTEGCVFHNSYVQRIASVIEGFEAPLVLVAIAD
jgi:hypothetical protein